MEGRAVGPAARRAGFGGMAGVMLGLVLGLHPVSQLLLGLAAFVVFLLFFIATAR